MDYWWLCNATLDDESHNVHVKDFYVHNNMGWDGANNGYNLLTALSSSPMAYKESFLDLIWTWRTSIPCKSPTRQRQKSKRQYLSNKINGKYLLRVQMEKGLGDTSPKSKWTRTRFARKLNPSLSRKGRNATMSRQPCSNISSIREITRPDTAQR